MLAKLRKDHENEEGFTLIELLVVVIIIGILAAIAIPAFLNQRQRGYQAALTSDVRNAAIEIESGFTATQTWPASTALDGQQLSSDGTTLYYTSNTTAGGFCIVGERDDLPGYILYNSFAGGIQTYVSNFNTTGCTVSDTAVVAVTGAATS